MKKTWIPACAGMTGLILLNAWGQSRLPPCPGAFAANKWTHCYGEAMTNSAARYAGEWKDDRYEGRGIYRYRNGDQYAGEFHDGRRHGQGTFTWRDGASYTGGYKNDLRSGRGTFTYPDGAKYVGEYRDDRRNGQGVEYRPDGSVLRSGTWKDDAFVPKR